MTRARSDWRPSSPEQLAADCANAIRTLVERPELRHRMGAAARERVATTHLWRHRFERMAEIYEQVIGVTPAAR